MESANKVRLVRCPNCENLLPELPDYSVYQCGGCGIVLRAKGRSDEEGIGAIGKAMEKRSRSDVSATRDVEPAVGSLSLNQRQSDKDDEGDAKSGILERKYRSGCNNHDGDRLLERDRQKLLRELDGLKDRLSQSAYMNRNACSSVKIQSDIKRHKTAGLPYFCQYPSSLCCPNGSNATHSYDPGIRRRFLPGCGLYDRLPPHGLIPGQYLDASCDPFGHIPTCSIPHQPILSCFHRVSDDAMDGSSYIGPRQSVPSYSSCLQHPRVRRSSEIRFESFMDRQPRRVVSFGTGRSARPIAGGAPFLTCRSCFELLRLPSSVVNADSRGKFRCGACDAAISCDLVNRKQLVFSTRAKSHGYVTGASRGFFSDEYSHSEFAFPFSERARATSIGGINSSPTTSGLSDREYSPSGLVTSGSDSVPEAVDAKHSLPPGSPLQLHLNHSSKRFDKGNESSRSDHEVLSSKAIARQNSLLETAPPAEVETSLNESFDDANRARDQCRANKGESFLSNIFKRSFKDLPRSGQGNELGKGKVFINGHPIPDRSIKKAEKLAGPIRSGKYWYDFRAGFWGIASGPCLGIIPPYIQEFNYPMTEDCAGGNTGVSVNGRELHQKDLDLLASRGLPLDRNRSYAIEISGRVYDEDTGEELNCLGRLAPTVEQAEHGFGMRAPKEAAAAAT